MSPLKIGGREVKAVKIGSRDILRIMHGTREIWAADDGGGDESNITFVGAASGVSTATLPAHQAGDLIIAYAIRAANNVPNLASGWTEIDDGRRASSRLGRRVAYRVATNDSTPAGTWLNATAVLFLVYRGVHATPIGAHAYTGGSGSVVTYGSAAVDAAGTSWLVALAGHRAANTSLESPPSGLTHRGGLANTVEVAGFDSAGGIAEWAGDAVTVGGTSDAWVTDVIEIRSA